MLIIAFPAFTILFLAASYFAGLYDNGYKQSRLNKSTAIAILVLLSVYSLLPESVRFSRGILLFGSLTAFVLMTIVRLLLLRWNIIESPGENDEINQTVIAGSENEFNEINDLLEKAGVHERILGRIEPALNSIPKTIGSFNDLENILQRYPVKEIIFCEGTLSFKDIIEVLPRIPSHLRIKLYSSCSNTLIGSDSKDYAGSYLSENSNFRLASPVSRRNKIMIDVVIAFSFIITFPIHFMIIPRPFRFFKNVFSVFLLKKTWIGYAMPNKNLPPLKEGILTSTGLPAYLNTLPDKSLCAADVLYAKKFSILNDVKVIWLNYKLLS
jgi:hypothetical protein